MTLDVGKAFTFMFEDPDWLRKLGIATAVALVGILFTWALIGFIPLIIVMGYTLETTRNVMEGRPRPLPEWDDWGRYLARGAKLFLVLLIWALPIIIIAAPITGIGSALTNANSGAANAFGGLLVACGACLSVLYGLLILLLEPALYARLAETDQIGSGFDFARLWAITRDNLANVIIAILMIIVAGIIGSIIGLAGIIALVIGVLVTFPFAFVWEQLVQAHLFGQIGAHGATNVVTTPGPTMGPTL